MIERLYLKNCLSFKEIDIEFKKGLVVFTGPSGAGKSVLIDTILSLFGIKTPQAKLSEITLNKELDLDSYGIENDDVIVIREVKKEKIRFFINSQSVSKKMLKDIFKSSVSYLSQKDTQIFTSTNILRVIDDISNKIFKEFNNLYEEFKKDYKTFNEYKERYKKIVDEEKRVNELIEFAKFEIEKIDAISPKIGEYEELLEVKKDLSKREKIEEAINRAEEIFEYESVVNEALDKIGIDSSFFDDTMNELRAIFEDEKAKLLELKDINIEEILNRIEELSDLKRRYGSIKEALKYRDEKAQELKFYENISFEKQNLKTKIKTLEIKLKNLAKNLSDFRKEAVKRLEVDINEFISELKLPYVSFRYSIKDMDITGFDKFDVVLKDVGFEKISSGEFNRLRLAFLSAWTKYKDIKKHILILDEIDANVSGEESMGIAIVLKNLSKNYQIFAISHQAQLSSIADQHFLVTKENNESKIKELGFNERVKEIARIISGEKITKEAEEFAKRILSRSEGDKV